jgi:hypothetical protein
LWLVRDGSLERVKDNLNVVVLGWQLLDLVGNSLGLSKGWDILSDTSEGENHVLCVRSAQLSLALLTENNELSIWLLLEDTASLLGQLRVDTTAKTFVGRSNNEECLASLERLGLGLLVDLVGSLTVDLGVGHGTLGTGELGGGDDLHGVGDLLDVTNGLETAFDFTEGSIVVGEEWLCRTVCCLQVVWLAIRFLLSTIITEISLSPSLSLSLSSSLHKLQKRIFPGVGLSHAAATALRAVCPAVLANIEIDFVGSVGTERECGVGSKRAQTARRKVGGFRSG